MGRKGEKTKCNGMSCRRIAIGGVLAPGAVLLGFRYSSAKKAQITKKRNEVLTDQPLVAAKCPAPLGSDHHPAGEVLDDIIACA